MARFVLAVSGGIDSVVLLDKLSKSKADFVVAHFDHGIREASRRDAEFVASLARQYGVRSYSARGNLGKDASEEAARIARYKYLNSVKNIVGAEAILTAQHEDDLIESMVINLFRGTGWRGINPMSMSGIKRPLLKTPKTEIVNYAIGHNLIWVEDETNDTPDYLRNRVRSALYGKLSDASRKTLIELYEAQKNIAAEVNDILKKLDDVKKIKRYDLVMYDWSVAIEILNFLTKNLLTRPQLDKLLLFAKTAAPEKEMWFGKKLAIKTTMKELWLAVS
jgi:tRNA(Ile)-lysidine synthetase-like protein